MLIVLDTNVLVSGLLKRTSKPGQIIDAILIGKIQLVIDQRTYQEYCEVLHRPKLNIPMKLADSILDFIAYSSSWIDCSSFDFSQLEIIDPGDLPFAELAISSNTIMITGNVKHFKFLQELEITVLQPGEFLSQFGQDII